MMLAAKKKAKKNVSFHSETECQHDQTNSDDRSKSVSNMLSPIHAACRKGDYLVVKHILSFYYGNECMNLVNSSCTCGMTPLQVACDNGHVKIAKLLLRRHAQPNKRGGKKRHHSCIAMACIQKNLDLAELLLQYGAAIDEEALVIASSSGYDDIVRLLINFRPKRNLSFDIPAQFLQKVAHPEIESSSLNKAASLAVAQDHPEILSILLGDGKHQASRSKVQACALDAAVQSDYRLLRALAKLYDASMLLDTKDGNSCTLLHHAVRNESVKSVMLLVRLGADVHVRDSGGITPLYIACARGQSSIARVLVEAGAKCVSMGPNDESPLHIAAQENHLACVEILLTHGRAPVDGVTRDLCTALHLACQRGNTQVAECLLDHGAQVNASTIGDETPLLKASRMSQFQTVRLLVSRGARTQAKSSSENRRGKENKLSTDEVELRIEQNYGGVSYSGASLEKTQGGEDSIFIAKSNTHTSLKKWIRSVLKSND
jgi:ankyrin